MLKKLRPLGLCGILGLTMIVIACGGSPFKRFLLNVVTPQADRNTPLSGVSVVVNGHSYVSDRAGIVDVTTEANSSEVLNVVIDHPEYEKITTTINVEHPFSQMLTLRRAPPPGADGE